MARRGRLSSLDLIPPEAEEDVAWAFAQLRERRMTQDEIRDQLNLRLQLKGLAQISRSAFNRAAIRTARTAHRLGEVREIAAAVATKLEDGGDGELTLLVSETIKTIVFEMLETSGEITATPKSAEMMANLALALKSAEQAKKTSVDARRVIEKDFRQAAEAAIDRTAVFKGLTPELRDAFKRELFGIRDG